MEKVLGIYSIFRKTETIGGTEIIKIRSLGTLSVKGQIVNVLGFASHTVLVITTQICRCSMKTFKGNR